jgi:hypothetical protein
MDMDGQHTVAGEKGYHDSAFPSRGESLETGHADIAGRDGKALEKRLVRKLDLYLIPLVMSLYLFSFLDR